MDDARRPHLAPNWTSAAGALDGILQWLGAPLPRHAVMGLTGHAWHLCLGEREGVVALPSGPTDMDWEAAVDRYGRTGYRWERFSGSAADRQVAIAWAAERLDAGTPLIGWDFHLHEFGIVYGVDRAREGFLVDDILSEDIGAFVAWHDWPSTLGRIELFAPVEPNEPDPIDTVAGAIETALACFDGSEANAGTQARGTRALGRWADAFEGDTEIDRAGNAYTLAVLQAARADGAAFLADLAESLPDLGEPFHEAERALRDEVKALSPLITLFPFPAGGHGNVASPGLRQAAAAALRRAAAHEREATTALREALRALEE
jgi:hypothetical protein